jgi:hypothetical protein
MRPRTLATNAESMRCRRSIRRVHSPRSSHASCAIDVLAPGAFRARRDVAERLGRTRADGNAGLALRMARASQLANSGAPASPVRALASGAADHVPAWDDQQHRHAVRGANGAHRHEPSAVTAANEPEPRNRVKPSAWRGPRPAARRCCLVAAPAMNSALPLQPAAAPEQKRRSGANWPADVTASVG